jgi:hypothetical protein
MEADQLVARHLEEAFGGAAGHDEALVVIEQQHDFFHALEELIDLAAKLIGILAGAADLAAEDAEFGLEVGELLGFLGGAERVGGELAGGDFVDGFADAGEGAEGEVGKNDGVKNGNDDGE